MDIGSMIGGVKTWLSENRTTMLMVGGLLLGLVVLGIGARACLSVPAEGTTTEDIGNLPVASSASEESDAGVGSVAVAEGPGLETGPSEALGASETPATTEDDGLVIVELPSPQEPVYEAVTTGDPESAD